MFYIILNDSIFSLYFSSSYDNYLNSGILETNKFISTCLSFIGNSLCEFIRITLPMIYIKLEILSGRDIINKLRTEFIEYDSLIILLPNRIKN